MKKVIISGTFDIIHPGHRDFFRQARQYGDKLIVIVARDQNVLKLKGHLPKFKENERVIKLEEEPLVDEVLLGRSNDPYDLIREEKPDVICLGYDQIYFTEKLQKTFPDIKIVRLKSFRPEIYKSSKMKDNHN